MDKNVRPHRTDEVSFTLAGDDVEHMMSPEYSPNLKHMNNVWDTLGRRIA